MYELVSQGKNMLIVESLIDRKKMPAYTHEKILSLGDIAMYTNEGEVPLSDVFAAMKKKEGGKSVDISIKKADNKTLSAYLESVLPDYDRDRVYASDIKKLISWYNILVEAGKTEFETEEKKEEKAEQ